MAARVSKGTVYHHFTDKAELFEAVFRDGQLRLLADVAQAGRRHRDPTGELAQRPTEMLARVLFGALCEAAMAAGADADPQRAQREAATALHTITAGLRRG